MAGKSTTYWITSSGKLFVNNRYGFSERKFKVTNCGYLEVNLYFKDKYQYKRLHRLVAETFLDNPEQKPYVCHKNGNKQDNRVENLYWGTGSENMKDHYSSGGKVAWGESLSTKLNKSDVFLILKMVAKGATQAEAGKRFGVTQSHVSRLCSGEVWGRLTKSLC